MSTNLRKFIASIPSARTVKAIQNALDLALPTNLDTGLTAHAGGTQAAGLALNPKTSFHDVTTVASAADSVLLPPAIEGEFHFVKNSAATNAMQVYGSGTDTIDSVATATGVSQLAGDAVLYVCMVAGNYLRLGGVAATETFTTITATTGNITTVNATNIDAGASGTAGTVDVFPATASKGKLILAAVNNDGDTNVTISNAAMGQASVVSIPDPGAATANFLLTSAANDQAVVTATSVELNYNDITTLGTLAASKAWTSDASLDTIMPTGGKLTVQSGGDITLNSGATFLVDTPTTTTVAAAEHGAGAIGTAATPKTRRWTERGVIVTQTTFDLTGLASVATANDVIGLAAGGAAYIGRNVVATNGVIFKTTIAVLETPAGGDNDVNLVTSSNAALAYDGAGGTTYLVGDLGDLLVGKSVENLVPALTEGDYYYLTAGTGDTAATYTAGMYILTTYGHAVLA